MKPLFKSVDQSRKTAVEEALVAAAERVLKRKGYDATTMREIAREAGCSNGSLYLYFETKEQLFESLVNSHASRLMQRMLESMQSTENLVDKLRLASRTNLEYFNEHQGFFRAFFLGRDGANLGLSGAGRSAYEKFKAYELTVIKKAQEERLVRADIPASELAALLQDVSVASMARWSRAPGSLSLDEQINTLWRFASGGLGIRQN